MPNEKVTLTIVDDRFVAVCDFASRGFVKAKGFIWCDLNEHWYTRNYQIATRLIYLADSRAKRHLSRRIVAENSQPGPMRYPKNHQPLPFQITAAIFALSRNNSYLALDPGLGKTIVAAIIANYAHFVEEAATIVYVCPPGLMANVKNEFDKWAPNVKIILIPDSKLNRHQNLGEIDLLVVDEAHRFKNETSKRSIALFGFFTPHASRVVFLSGTPLPNRPMELYPVLSHCAHNIIDFMNKFEYALKYCAAHRNQWGWDFSGASNMKLFAQKVKNTFLLRMRKKDVLKDLPEKLEEMVVIAENLPSVIGALDRRILKEESPEDLMKPVVGSSHISTYRRELGKIKAKLAIDYVKDILQDTDESVLVFAIHTEVIAELEAGLKAFHPVVITGQTRTDLRQGLVNEFQSSKDKRLFLGNVQAAGVGFTLTKAARVVFVEFSWTPADNDQASDRAHRIGQSKDVLVTYLVFKNSVDRQVLETILRKRKIIEHI